MTNDERLRKFYPHQEAMKQWLAGNPTPELPSGVWYGVDPAASGSDATIYTFRCSKGHITRIRVKPPEVIVDRVFCTHCDEVIQVRREEP